MTSAIRWRLPDSAPPDYPAIKRFVDAWFCDAGFAERFARDPADELAGLGIDLDPKALAELVSPEQVASLTNPLREGASPTRGTLATEWRRYAIERYRAVGRERSERSPADRELATWRWRQIARLKLELSPSSAGQIRHIPFAMELTRGCSGRCWFCGISAEPLTGVFERTPENVQLFRGLLAHLRDVFGPTAAGDGILYWATDPIDHPEYEAFVEDFAEIVGPAPSTVTALAGRNPDRAASILKTLSRHPARSHRFSVLSARDYRTIIERFDADALASVELLPQFRKDLDLKFAAGRARKRMLEGGEASTSARGGTIACLSGLLVDMVGRTIRLVTPCPSSEHRPDGVHESTPVPFADLASGIRVIDELLGHVRSTVDSDEMVLERSAGVRFEAAPDIGVVRIHTAHHALRVKSPVDGDRLDSMLPPRTSAAAMFEALTRDGGADPVEALTFLGVLLDTGAYRSCFPGEGAALVDLAVGGTPMDRSLESAGR